MIKYNVKTVNDWLYNSNPIKKLYYNGMVRYRRFVANGSPTPPIFDGKFKAEYSDGTSYSAACDGNTSLTTGTTRPRNYVYTAMTSAEVGQCITTINNNAFDSCTSLTSVNIPSGVTSIGQYAFGSCTSLTSIDVPNSVTSIGGFAFNNCISLTSITIPDSVTSIGNAVFNSCTNLSSVTFGSGLTTIGNSVFNQCSNVTTITSYAVVPPSVGSRAFDDIRYTVTDVYVPDEAVNTYKAASGWGVFASRIKPISEKPQ